MPRQPRLILPDVALHIVHRGHNRLACFRDEGDFRVYLALVLQGARNHQCAVHAYCLMANHVHVLVTPPAPKSCQAFMHGIAQRYASYHNRKYQCTGTLWEGRFRSCLVESSQYVLACYRYIELNPVRAGIVGDPLAYPWSSYSGNSGARRDPLLTPHVEFALLTQSSYVAFVAYGVDSQALIAIRDAMNGGYPFASESFRSAISVATGMRTTPGRPGRPARVSEESGKSVAVPDLFSGGGVS
jgi:putative transposase